MFFEFFLHKKLKNAAPSGGHRCSLGERTPSLGSSPTVAPPGEHDAAIAELALENLDVAPLGERDAATATGECATAAAEELSRCWWPVAAPLRSSERLREREKRWIWI